MRNQGGSSHGSFQSADRDQPVHALRLRATREIFTLVLIVPFARGIYFTFRDWNGFETTKWVGFGELQRGLVRRQVLVLDVAHGEVRRRQRGLRQSRGLRPGAARDAADARHPCVLRTVFPVPNLLAGVILGLVRQFLSPRPFL
ncbi:MAG: hypothetical protein R2710_27800 [Acidimicrobiales bacterium]